MTDEEINSAVAGTCGVDAISDRDLAQLKDFRDSAKAILNAMKRRKFSAATRIRNHAKFILDVAHSKISVEESRRIFCREMKREREKKQ